MTQDASKTWHGACASDDVQECENWPATVAGVAVCLYRHEGQVYATVDQCSHGNARLSDGYVEGFEIECPFHQGRFDFRTGLPTLLPCTEPIRTFHAMERDGTIWIAVDGDPAA